MTVHSGILLPQRRDWSLFRFLVLLKRSCEMCRSFLTHSNTLCRLLGIYAPLFVVLSLSCDLCLAVTPPALPLHTAGGAIVDSNGVRVHLNAVNWYGSEGEDYVVEGLQANTISNIVHEIQSRGFNAVRLPWSLELYENNPVVGNYALTANPALEGNTALTILDQVVNALTGAGIMVILDNHGSSSDIKNEDGCWYDSAYPESSWINGLEGMAQRYANNPLVIGMDLRNEPHSTSYCTATWGGSANTDWHAAAERGGNAVLSVNANLLIFVEGVNYAADLSGVSSLPIALNVANHVVYEAHDYGFWYSGLAGYTNWYNKITPKWGYLVNGSNPQPLWIGEFGTCHTASTCVSSTNNTDKGYWFDFITSYIRDFNVDWSYWAMNGTTETQMAAGFGGEETYGVLNMAWNGDANSLLTTRLQSLMPPGVPGFSLIPNSGTPTIAPGNIGSSTVVIVPENGFTGAVNLSCSVSGPTGSVNAPTCNVPSSENITGTAAVSALVSIATTGVGVASHFPGADPRSTISRTTGGALLVSAMLFIGSLQRRRRSVLLLLIVMGAVFSTAISSGCGGSGGSGSSPPGTTTGTYTITVTGSASGLNPVTTQIAVNVQ
ncbi:MAG: glycoside hydrolase family 5 protein [Acidobacteriota bacterium]|nr:glycoside hydrolase family 5 protein [Acidobacteriota bacterium]